MKTPWYEIKAKKDNAEVLIYEQIGTDLFTGKGVGAKQFIEELNAIKNPNITLRINSPGGNVFDGNAIYNALKAHRAEKHVKIDGLAASIASIIAMAGDTIEMPENAMMMVHKASGLAMGNEEAMLSMASALSKIDDGIIGIYHARSNLDRGQIETMLSDETWITAREAVQFGMADTITEQVNIQNCFTGEILGRFKNVPDKFKPTGETFSNKLKKEKPSMGKGPDNPEAAWEKAWNAEADLRSEFQGEKDRWLCYARAQHNGLVKICTGGKSQNFKGENHMVENKSEVLGDETDWNKSWDSDQELRDEFFGDRERWLAFKRAEKNGQVKLFKS